MPSPNQYHTLIETTFQELSLPAALGLAIARIESNFNPIAINLGPGDKQRGGAYGLCQMTFRTAKALGFKGKPENLYEPKLNVSLAAKLCDANASRIKYKFDSLEWRQDILAMYNSGKSFKTAPAMTRLGYVPTALSFYTEYEAKGPSSAPRKALT